MGERTIAEEILKDQFELKWKELDEKLRALPVTKEPVPKARSNEEMFSEIVEAVRAGAAGGKAVEQVRDELRGLREVLARVVEARREFVYFPSRTSNLSSSVNWDAVLEELASGAPIASEDEMVARARLIREILEKKKLEGSDTAKKADDEKK